SAYSEFFFFSRRRRHTRSKRDWSSDVCSSDLALQFRIVRLELDLLHDALAVHDLADPHVRDVLVRGRLAGGSARVAVGQHEPVQIGRASCRERVEMSGVVYSVDAVEVGVWSVR